MHHFLKEIFVWPQVFGHKIQTREIPNLFRFDIKNIFIVFVSITYLTEICIFICRGWGSNPIHSI